MRQGISWLILPLCFLHCGGSDEGSNQVTGGSETGNATAVRIEVLGYQSSNLARTLLPSLTVGDVDITTARVVLDRLRFRPFADCSDDDGGSGEDEIRFDGPFVADLLNPETIDGLEELEIPTGRYCRIEITFKVLQPDNLPAGVAADDPLVERSILIEGKRSDGIPFRMTTETDEEFELDGGSDGFPIEASSGIQVLLIAFDLDQWLSGINLSDPSVELSTDSNGDPVILVDDDLNEEIQETLEDNLKLSADLFEDEDQDGELDEDEDEDDDSLAEGDLEEESEDE